MRLKHRYPLCFTGILCFTSRCGYFLAFVALCNFVHFLLCNAQNNFVGKKRNTVHKQTKGFAFTLSNLQCAVFRKSSEAARLYTGNNIHLKPNWAYEHHFTCLKTSVGFLTSVFDHLTWYKTVFQVSVQYGIFNVTWKPVEVFLTRVKRVNWFCSSSK